MGGEWINWIIRPKVTKINLRKDPQTFLPAAKRQVKGWRGFVIFAREKTFVTFLLFLPLCLEYFQLVPLHGCLGTCLDPSYHIWDNLNPGAKFWVQGPFGPKFKNCNFLTKPYNMGVYGLAWTPAIIFETIWTLGPNFGSKGPLAPNLKIAIFSQNLTIWVSMDLPGPQHSYLK